MVCDRCKKREATSYFKMVINGVVTEKHLCSDCASLETMEDKSYFDIFDNLLSHSFDFNFMPSFTLAPAFASPNRGRSIIDQAKNSIRVGANKFREEVNSNPNSLKLMNLRRELSSAIESEDYEKASELKKEIDSIEKGDKNV